MNHLSGMDAMFLHVESPDMPMHVGSLNVLELPEGYQGNFYEDVKALVAQRLHLSDVFTRKLALMPFDISNPVWVEDEDIDLDYHVRHITLPSPGSNRLLQQTVARLHSSLLDRSRPLWEIMILDGLKSGEVALYFKIHHSGIDGQAGVAMSDAIFDSTPHGRVIRPPRPRPRSNKYQLGVAELAGAALSNLGVQYGKLFKMLPAMGKAARDLASAPSALRGEGSRRRKLGDLVAPRTPLNVAITNQRVFAARTVPLAEVKAMAKRFGVSFNDVVLGVTAGALRRYLDESNELPEKSLSAAVPVSLREAGDTTANNQVSMLVADLATDETDRIKRLQRINKVTAERKATLAKMKSAIPMDFPMFGAPWLMSGLASMYGRSRLANVMPPMANVLVSNVATRSDQMYFAGARVISNFPVSIPSHGMALNVTVQSYNNRLDYGLIACRRAVPNISELGDYFLEEHRVLHELSLALAPAPAAPEATKAAAPSKAPRQRRPAPKPALIANGADASPAKASRRPARKAGASASAS